ncbi:MAG: sporulation protein YunB, partial [Pygmaiobacter sp.]
ARVASILAINDAVLERMAQEDPHLELVEIQRDSDGRICAIEANTIEINRLKSELTVAVGQKLAEIQRTKISIPLGTLLGWQIFAGRGPDIGFKIVPASFVHSDIKSTLISAGINQTRHQIILAFTVEMTAIIPGYTTSVTVTTEVCVAETLIVGEVPQLFAPGNE